MIRCACFLRAVWVVLADSQRHAISVTSSFSHDSPRRRVKIHDLNLVQLKQLADRGHERARLELHRRLEQPRQEQPAVRPPLLAQDSSRAVATATASQKAMPGVHAKALASDAQQPAIEQLQWLEKQENKRAFHTEVPRFIGLVVLVWGLLFSFAGGIMLLAQGGPYYLASGLVCVLSGYLLMRLLRWSIVVQLTGLALMLTWAFLESGFVQGILQAVPLIVASAWVLFPGLREPLS